MTAGKLSTLRYQDHLIFLLRKPWRNRRVLCLEKQKFILIISCSFFFFYISTEYSISLLHESISSLLSFTASLVLSNIVFPPTCFVKTRLQGRSSASDCTVRSFSGRISHSALHPQASLFQSSYLLRNMLYVQFVHRSRPLLRLCEAMYLRIPRHSSSNVRPHV
jgi:hypothetical protein